MLIKNIFRILYSYRLSLVKIIFFEIIYLLKGYKGNKFNFFGDQFMTDNIPCPYYFLTKIENNLKNNDFSTFLDMGCGSGRAINFFNKKFLEKKFIGIEFFSSDYSYCKDIFKNNSNIEILKGDFMKLDILKYNADCYFFNDPFKNPSDIINLLEKLYRSSYKEKKILFIFVNINLKIIQIPKYIRLIESFNINNHKGYSIYYLDKNLS